MEVQVQELVEKIKQDGVQHAQKKADEIVADAHKQAEEIIQKAHQDAADLIKKGEEEAKRFETASVSAIKQASRNTLLAFRDSVTEYLEKLIQVGTQTAYDATVLKALIPSAVTEWIKKGGSGDISILLAEKDVKALGDSFFAGLKKDIDDGLELKIGSVDSGFRIGTKDGAAYYDFSAEAVADLFSLYLSTKAGEILNEVAKEL